MVEVTLRTVHGRFLLRPSRRLNDLVVGVVGRAQRKHRMKVHALVVLSSHLHALLSPESPQQLAAFMSYLAGNVAREIGRLHEWREKFWARRFSAIIVSGEEEAQIGRLVYLLANGVKEGMVDRPQDWPGVHCAAALLTGQELEGHWIDRTAEYMSRRRGESGPSTDFAEREGVAFSPLPCWASLGGAEYRTRVKTLIVQVVEEGRRARGGRRVLGRRSILQQHPHHKPAHCDRSPAPLVHAATKRIRLMLRAAYWQFVAAFREAATRLKRGDPDVRFPPGAFPPPLPCLVASG
jgi:REP element-mobilizing transposase RayT